MRLEFFSHLKLESILLQNFFHSFRIDMPKFMQFLNAARFIFYRRRIKLNWVHVRER